jgi:hypothetical protein
MRLFLAGVAFLVALAFACVAGAALINYLRLGAGLPWGPPLLIAIGSSVAALGFICAGAMVLANPSDDPPA